MKIQSPSAQAPRMLTGIRGFDEKPVAVSCAVAPRW